MTKLSSLLGISLISISTSGCLMSGSSDGTQQSSILVSEIVNICGAIVGTQAETRINQEWAKYPEAEANRPIIEAVAETLLNDPTATEEQRTSQYRKYLTCATGLLMTNKMTQ